MYLKKVASMTLGCKVNLYDTEAMLELFEKRGYKLVGFDEPADVYIVNTCTVTNLGDKKSRQMLRRAKRLNPNAVVVAAGCYAQVASEEVRKIPEVDLIIGTKDRGSIVDYAEQALNQQGTMVKVSSIMSERSFEELSVEGLANRSRAYLKIQEGCNQFCAYCIIPYARGPVRSRSEEAVVKEVKTLAAKGYKEIVLAGIHVASYGKDLKGTGLKEVIERVHQVDGIERIRMSSIEPRAVTRDFLDALAKLPKVCDHFHLSLQSGCDATLKRMNRKYTAAQYLEAANMLRQYFPSVALTTDIIVGFPGETHEDFCQSMEFAAQIGFSRIHVFPYSPKAGTPAAEFPNQLPQQEKNARCKEMIALGRKMSLDFLAGFVGKELSVLYETHHNGIYSGHSSNYLTVQTPSNTSLLHQISRVKINCVQDGDEPSLISAPTTPAENF